MFKMVTLVVSFALLVGGLFAPEPVTVSNAEIYVFMGASNMSGRGTMPPYQETFANVYGFDDSFTLVPGREPSDKPARRSKDPVSRDIGAGFSPVMSFFSGLAPTNPGKTYVFINCAAGGSSLASWKRNLSETSLYGFCLKRIRLAQAFGTVKGLLFINGEYESQGVAGRPAAQNWGNDFMQLVNDLRGDLGSDVPVVYARLNPKMPGKFNSIVYDEQTRINGLLPAFKMADTDGLYLAPNSFHYKTGELKIIGSRMAAAMLEILGPEIVIVSRLPAAD
jgi:hypothetical protein